MRRRSSEQDPCAATKLTATTPPAGAQHAAADARATAALTVRVRLAPLCVRDLDPADDEFVALRETVEVKAVAHAVGEDGGCGVGDARGRHGHATAGGVRVRVGEGGGGASDGWSECNRSTGVLCFLQLLCLLQCSAEGPSPELTGC